MPRRALTLIVVAALVAAIAGAGPSRAQQPAHDCSVPAELIESSSGKLPQLAQRLAHHEPITIVAIGSSSTAGAGLPVELAYPRRLQDELTRRFPETPIKVLNKGLPRQTAQEMVDRFETDVFAEHPNLVIWETGTAEAVRGMDVDGFAATLDAGIGALRDRQIEVVLIDMQYSRHTISVIEFSRYLEAMHRFAELDEVVLFRRFEIMNYWSDEGIFDFEDVPKGERTELAAEVYQCIGARLADSIGDALR